MIDKTIVGMVIGLLFYGVSCFHGAHEVAAQQNQTIITYSIFLHGIGSTGDNSSAGNTYMSTKLPKITKKNVTLFFYNPNGTLALAKTGIMNFDHERGGFTGKVTIENNRLAGSYQVKVKSPSYLVKRIPAAITISPGKTVALPNVTLTAGDFNDDNILNVVDYNMIMGCYSDLLKPVYCNAQLQRRTDLSADLRVNAHDYNLYLREMAVIQNGD
jgi:hypothetical protein